MSMFTSLITRKYRPGAFVKATEKTCDCHVKRPAVLAVIGEIDGFGAEYNNCCEYCVKKILTARYKYEQDIAEGRVVLHGYCDDCQDDVCGIVEEYRDNETRESRDLCTTHMAIQKKADRLANVVDEWEYDNEDGEATMSLKDLTALRRDALDKAKACALPRTFAEWVDEQKAKPTIELGLKERLQAKFADRLQKA